MIQKASDHARAELALLDIPCPDFPITWAGRGRHNNEFCFGAEDGRLRFVTINGDLIDETPVTNEHSEAVNGVEFNGNLMAVSSRAEVVFWKMPHPPDNHWVPASCSYGSHGVIVTAFGDFLCPLGPNGVMRARSSAKQDHVSIERVRAHDQALDYYNLISLESHDGEMLVCALRRNGIATIECHNGADPTSFNFTIHGDLDVIDVCSLATGDAPRAAAGLCRDGTLFFFNDVLDQSRRVALRYDAIQGTAYRLLSAHGGIIVLTSRALYAVPDCVPRLLQGNRAAGPISGFVEPLEAIDANLVNDRWLLIAMPDQVRRYDIAEVLGRRKVGPTESSPLFGATMLDLPRTSHAGSTELVPS